ncbi:MAG: hypothetical protein KGS47_11550 [Chloroflexi bacterium]|nr:hypothetical protein [Chloroflexota bacterium]
MRIERPRRHVIALWIILVIIQISDMFMHWAFAQLETVRVVGNIILPIGALLTYWRISRFYLLGGFAMYMIANVAFLLHEGWMTDHGTLRYPLIAFIIFTTWMTVLFDRRFLKSLVKHKISPS